MMQPPEAVYSISAESIELGSPTVEFPDVKAGKWIN